jgi:recombination protein RecT
LKSEDAKQFVSKIIQTKPENFLTSMLSVVASNNDLQACTATSIMGACIKASLLNLPFDPNLGLAYIIPYQGAATFQIGWRGYLQLAMNTGQYVKLNVCDVRQGEILEVDEFTESYKFCRIPDDATREKAVIVGYYAQFELLNGYKKELYWSIQRILNHAKKFSKSYNSSSSPWKAHQDAMCRKTMLRTLIRNWGVMSTTMQEAYGADMRTVEYNEEGQEVVNEYKEPETTVIEVSSLEEEFKNGT